MLIERTADRHQVDDRRGAGELAGWAARTWVHEYLGVSDVRVRSARSESLNAHKPSSGVAAGVCGIFEEPAPAGSRELDPPLPQKQDGVNEEALVRLARGRVEPAGRRWVVQHSMGKADHTQK